MQSSIFQEIFKSAPKSVRIFLVGGAVRDWVENPDQQPDDFDFAVEGVDLDGLIQLLADLGFQGFRGSKDPHGFNVKPAEFGVKCRGPVGSVLEGQEVDFVACRHESDEHPDGVHPAWVKIGNQRQDAERRDFSVNSIAIDVISGEVIDHFGGVADLQSGVLRSVGSAAQKIKHNPVRAARAIRFIIVRGFEPDAELAAALRDPEVIAAVSAEDSNRVRVQLNRIFALGPEVLPRALAVLAEFPELSQAFFSNGLNLQASAKAPKVR